MSDQSQPDPADPPESSPTLPEVAEPDINRLVLTRVRDGLDEAIHALEAPDRRKIWLLLSPAIASPELHEIATREELYARLREIKQRVENPEDGAPADIYGLHIFYGERWLMQLGAEWGVWDTQKVTSINENSAAIPTYLDLSGVIVPACGIPDVEPDEPAAPPPDEESAAPAGDGDGDGSNDGEGNDTAAATVAATRRLGDPEMLGEGRAAQS